MRSFNVTLERKPLFAILGGSHKISMLDFLLWTLSFNIRAKPKIALDSYRIDKVLKYSKAGSLDLKKGKDISAKFEDLYLVHQNAPGKKASSLIYPQNILFIPLQGEIRISIDGKSIKFGLGQMLYLPPNMLHSFSSSDQFGERLIAMIHSDAFRKANLPSQLSILPLNQLIKEILFYLLLHPKTKNAKSLVGVFCETLIQCFSEAPVQLAQDHLESKVLDPRIRAALKYMQDNLDGHLNIEKIAQEAGLSGRNFNRLVLKCTGLQPKQWLINYRIEKAKALLKTPGTSVTDVAFSVGYNSLGQFIAAFRSRTGQLPSEYLRHG